MNHALHFSPIEFSYYHRTLPDRDSARLDIFTTGWYNIIHKICSILVHNQDSFLCLYSDKNQAFPNIDAADEIAGVVPYNFTVPPEADDTVFGANEDLPVVGGCANGGYVFQHRLIVAAYNSFNLSNKTALLYFLFILANKDTNAGVSQGTGTKPNYE